MKTYEERVLDVISEIKNYGFGMLNDMLNPEYVDCDEEKQSTRLKFKRYKWQDNGRGEVHGGVISAMMDTSMGITAIAISGGPVSTSDLTVNFIRPFNGKNFIIESEAMHVGRRIIRTTAKAYDEKTNKLLALATANIMFVSHYGDAPQKLGV